MQGSGARGDRYRKPMDLNVTHVKTIAMALPDCQCRNSPCHRFFCLLLFTSIAAEIAEIGNPDCLRSRPKYMVYGRDQVCEENKNVLPSFVMFFLLKQNVFSLF